MKHHIATVELADGSTLKARVGIHSKIAWEKAAKHNKWNAEDNPFTVNLFWAWHATRHAALHEHSWDEFQALVVDCDLKVIDPSDEDDSDPDPTQTAPGTDSP